MVQKSCLHRPRNWCLHANDNPVGVGTACHVLWDGPGRGKPLVAGLAGRAGRRRPGDPVAAVAVAAVTGARSLAEAEGGGGSHGG